MKKWVLLLVILLVGCSQTAHVLDDQLQFEIQRVNEHELEFLIEQVGNFTKQEIERNYAVVVFDYTIANGKQLSSLTVEHNFNWLAFMEQIQLADGLSYINGDSQLNYFKNGSFQRESNRFIFYANDFSKEQLQQIFQSYQLNVTWQADGKQIEKTIFVGDALVDRR